MHRARGRLKYDCIGQLNVPGIAVCVDANAAGYGGDGTNGNAQRQRGRAAEAGEVSERHLDPLAAVRPSSKPVADRAAAGRATEKRVICYSQG